MEYDTSPSWTGERKHGIEAFRIPSVTENVTIDRSPDILYPIRHSL